MSQEKIESMIKFGLSHLNKPYRWGGNGPNNFDCSGFILACLKSVDLFPAFVDVTAQDIFNYLSDKNWVEKKCRGAICFFGKTRYKITHIGLMIDEYKFLGANGGNSKTINDKIALEQNAKVDIRPLRKDLVAALFIKGV